MPTKRTTLVRYVSPFGSTAWMPLGVAEHFMAEDDARWLRNQEAGVLTEKQRKVGPPRIEREL